MPKIHNGERRISSINGTEKTACPHAKERNWIPILYHTSKLAQNELKSFISNQKLLYSKDNNQQLCENATYGMRENIANHVLDKN